MDATDVSVSKIAEIREIIQGLSVNSGLTVAESIFVIERAFEKALFGEYTVQFDNNYEIYAVNSEHAYHIKSMSDVNRLRHQAFVEITETRKKYVEDLKSYISLKEIANLIANEINKLATINAFTQFSYLIYRYVKGFILGRIDGGYIVNIGTTKVAYFYTDMVYEMHTVHIFLVKAIRKEKDMGTIKIILEMPERYKKILDIYDVFKNRNGKIVKNDIAVRVTKRLVWVFTASHRETLYRQEIEPGNHTGRELALLAAKSVFDAYAFPKKRRAESS
jgi:hypothetical protein